MRETDKALAASFSCGVEEFQIEISNWISEGIWAEYWRPPTTVAIWDEQFAGFATWSYPGYRAIEGKHLFISHFGVDLNFRAPILPLDPTIGERLLHKVEELARAEASEAKVPAALVCHPDNEEGKSFWDAQGFTDLGPTEASTYLLHVREPI